jgi:hypothetical protein
MTIVSLVLIGWQFNIERFKRVIPGLVEMNPMTAVSFLLNSVALWVLSNKTQLKPTKRAAAVIFASLAIVVGASKLADLFLHTSFELDQLLFRKTINTVFIGTPNRMAPNTALNIVLLGFALVLIDIEFEKKYRPAQLLTLIFGSISLVAVVGYAYNMVNLYGIPTYIPMALHAALCFLILGIGLFLARPHAGVLLLLTKEGILGKLWANLSLRKKIVSQFWITHCLTTAFFRHYSYQPELHS